MKTTSKLTCLKKSPSLNRAADYIFVIDSQSMMFADANETVLQSLGYSKKELLRIVPLHITPVFSSEVLFALLDAIINGKEEEATIPALYKRKDNTTLDVAVYLNCYEEAGHSYIIAAATDTGCVKKVGQNRTFHSASERRFRALFQYSLDGIALLSKEGIILDISPSVEKITGLSREDLINTSHFDVLAAEDVSLVSSAFTATVKGLKPETVEYKAISHDRTTKWLECTYSNLLSEPAVNAIVLNFRDVTKRRKAEEENSFRANLLNTIGQAVVSTDLQGSITYWNKAAEELYGWMEDEAIGRNIVDVTPAHQTKDQAIRIMEELNKGHAWSGEFDVQRKDKTSFPAFVTDSPIFDRDNRLTGIIGVSTNITDRKVFENELKESESRYRKAQFQGKLGHWQMNLANKKIFWSDEVYKLFHLNPLTTTPDFETFLNCVHPEDKQFLLEELKLTVNGFKDYNLVHRVILPSGQIRYFHEVGEVVKNESGKPVMLAGMVQDVTEQKLTEEELSVSEKNYKLLFEESPEPLWMLQASSLNFIDVNQKAVEQYGYSKEEFLRMSIADICGEEDKGGFDRVINNCGENIAFKGTVKHKRKNGDIIYVKITTNRIPYKHQQVWLVAARDITQEILFKEQLQKSQQQLSLIYNSILDAMWLLRVEDANVYRVESVNSAYSNITGVEKEKVIGHLSEEVICLGNTDYIRSRYNEAVQTAQVVSFFTTAQFKEGPITAEIRMIPIANEEGKVVQLLGIAHNVTHQQKARKNLLKMNLQLRELTSHLHKVREEERTNMAREIHDELGQQLTGIKMDISWLGKKINTTDENIRNRINLLLQLADGTINTVRKIAAELRPGVLYDLGLAEAIDWHSKEFSKRTGIPVTFWTNVRDRKIPPDISIHIFRILQESLTNVARHANASKVHCDLLIHESRLLLIVADDGTGFDLRVASSKMTLGLLGMKERVAMINGKHEIVASPGSGTSISIEVPIPA